MSVLHERIVLLSSDDECASPSSSSSDSDGDVVLVAPTRIPGAPTRAFTKAEPAQHSAAARSDAGDFKSRAAEVGGPDQLAGASDAGQVLDGRTDGVDSGDSDAEESACKRVRASAVADAGEAAKSDEHAPVMHDRHSTSHTDAEESGARGNSDGNEREQHVRDDGDAGGADRDVDDGADDGHGDDDDDDADGGTFSVGRLQRKLRSEMPLSSDAAAEDGAERAARVLSDERVEAEALIKTDMPLSDEQLRVIDDVREGKSVFVTGPAGTGKSVTICEAIRVLRGMYDDESVFVTASTGAAAVLIGGTTLHSYAGIGLGRRDANELLFKVVLCRPAVVARWRRTRALVIDEISMVDAELFDKLDYIARYVRDRFSEPFGGIQVVLCGDFFQLPPVTGVHYTKNTSLLRVRGRGVNGVHVINDAAFAERPRRQFAFEAAVWPYLVDAIHQLTRSYRHDADEDLLRILSEIRRGACSTATQAQLVAVVERSKRERAESAAATVAELRGLPVASSPSASAGAGAAAAASSSSAVAASSSSRVDEKCGSVVLASSSAGVAAGAEVLDSPGAQPAGAASAVLSTPATPSTAERATAMRAAEAALRGPVRLYARRRIVLRENELCVAKLPMPEQTYVAVDMAVSRMFYGIIQQCTAPRVLRLRVGALVICLRNIDVAHGIVNGTRGVVVGFSEAPAMVGHAPEVCDPQRVPLEGTPAGAGARGGGRRGAARGAPPGARRRGRPPPKAKRDVKAEQRGERDGENSGAETDGDSDGDDDEDDDDVDDNDDDDGDDGDGDNVARDRAGSGARATAPRLLGARATLHAGNGDAGAGRRPGGAGGDYVQRTAAEARLEARLASERRDDGRLYRRGSLVFEQLNESEGEYANTYLRTAVGTRCSCRGAMPNAHTLSRDLRYRRGVYADDPYHRRQRQLWPVVRFENDKELIMHPAIWEVRQGDAWRASRCQVPLMLGYAVTIHRSQGLTLKRVEVSVADSFDCGMVYVALSRARALADITLLDFDADKIEADESAKLFYANIGEYSGRRRDTPLIQFPSIEDVSDLLSDR